MEIRIYVEGGGDSKDSKAEIRRGLGKFLEELREKARSQRIRWNITACGSRKNAYDGFKLAQEKHPNAFNVLLVDSEVPVTSCPFEHLASSDGWQTSVLLNDRYHLMVQIMEAWFIADVENLRVFYGIGFNINPIPKRRDVEQIDKGTILSELAAATRNTQKGEYHKIRHGAKLLGLIDSSHVKQVSPHCERLFQVLSKKMQPNNN
jgi:hypothetical protein